MQARLKVVQDNANLKQVKLLPLTVIGRGAECHLKIASTQVSRKHCRITVTDNEVLIEDLTSSNGTFVDQEKIPPGKPIVVAPGTKLQVGPATFIVDYTPPVNLETMPTTVIKAAELSALNQVAIPKPSAGSESSIPTIDPFAAAVADGTAPAGVITPNPAPEVSLPEASGINEAEQTAQMVASATASAKPPTIVEPVAIADAMATSDSTITPQAPVLAQQVLAQVPAIAPIVAPILDRPVINVVEQPALVPAAVLSSPPLVAAPIAPPTPAVAVPMPVAVAPVSTAVAAPVAVAVPVPPTVAASVSEFDFLGGAASAAEPAAIDAFQFDVAAPAPAAAAISAPEVTASKPAPAKKPLFGLFGKKEKAAAPPAAAPTTAPPIALPSPSAASDPFHFAPPADPSAVPAAPPIAPPPAAPASAPAESDDPFAFLR